MRLVKFGFRFFYERVVRVLLSALLIIATLAMIGWGIGIVSFGVQDAFAYYFINGVSKEKLPFDEDSSTYRAYQQDREEMEIVQRYRFFCFDGQAQPTLEQLQSYERDIAAVSGGRYVLMRKSRSVSTKETSKINNWQLDSRSNNYGDSRCGWYYPEAFVGIAGTSELFAPNGLLAPVPIYNKYIENVSDAEGFYSQIVCYPNEETLQDLGCSLYGRLPEQADEVAIPYTLYQAFLSYGYRYAAKPNEETARTDGAIAITCPDDILGKEIAVSHGTVLGFGSDAYPYSYAKIVGIVSPREDSEELARLTDFLRKKKPDNSLVLFYWQFPCFALAVHSDFMAKYCPDTYYDSMVVSGACSKAKLRQYFDVATKEQATSLNRYFKENRGYLPDVSFRSYAITHAEAVLISSLWHWPSAWEAYAPYLWVLVPFGMLLTAYTILSTLSGKKRDMRLLRSLGASKGQMAWMLVLPVLLFCIVCSCAAGVAAQLALERVTKSVFYWQTLIYGGAHSLFSPGALGWLAMFGIPLAMGGISIAILFAAQEKLMQGKEHRLSEALRGKFSRRGSWQ